MTIDGIPNTSNDAATALQRVHQGAHDLAQTYHTDDQACRKQYNRRAFSRAKFHARELARISKHSRLLRTFTGLCAKRALPPLPYRVKGAATAARGLCDEKGPAATYARNALAAVEPREAAT